MYTHARLSLLQHMIKQRLVLIIFTEKKIRI